MPKLIKYRFLVLAVFAFLTLLSLWKIPKLEANYQFDDFFPKQDSLFSFYKEIQKEFDTSAEFLMIAFENSPDVFEPNFISKLDSFSNTLLKDTSVNVITGLHNYKEVQKTPFGYLQKKMLNRGSKNYEFQKEKFLNDPRTKNTLINEKRTAICLFVNTKARLSDQASNNLIDNIFSYSKSIGLAAPKLAGHFYTETLYVRQLEKENIKLTSIFILVISIVLLILYRSLIASLVPTISVIAGLLLLFGYAAWIGRSINVSTLMYPTVMAVVGMSDLIHLYTKYQDLIVKGFDKIEAINKSLFELRNTLFLTSLTTVIGFLSISFSKIPYVHSFGIDAAIGVGIAFLIAIFLTPIILYYIPKRLIQLKTNKWDFFLHKIYSITKTHSNAILGISLILLILGLWGTLNINKNNKLLDAISEKSTIMQEFKYFEDEFAGVRALELVLMMNEGHYINDLKVLQDIHKIETYLHGLESIGNVFSPASYYKSLNDIQSGPLSQAYNLPDKESDLRTLERIGKTAKNPLVNEDYTKGLISGRMQDIGRLEMNKTLDQLNDWISKNIQNPMFEIKTTGRDSLIDRTNELMIDSLFQGLIFALALISIIIGFLFKSFKLAILSLVPNILPLIFTAGIMGLVGIELNGSSAIIFTIAFVIAVDDTIHFLKKYSFIQKQQPNIDKEALIKQTILEAGKAIIITSIILISGYAVLTLSEFKEAYYHGILICFTMIGAVLADLLLLPILMRKFA